MLTPEAFQCLTMQAESADVESGGSKVEPDVRIQLANGDTPRKSHSACQTHNCSSSNNNTSIKQSCSHNHLLPGASSGCECETSSESGERKAGERAAAGDAIAAVLAADHCHQVDLQKMGEWGNVEVVGSHEESHGKPMPMGRVLRPRPAIRAGVGIACNKGVGLLGLRG